MHQVGRALFRREPGIHKREIGGVLRSGYTSHESDKGSEDYQYNSSGIAHLFSLQGVELPLPAARLKTEILAEKLHHMILETIGYFTRVCARVQFEAVRDSILVKDAMQ